MSIMANATLYDARTSVVVLSSVAIRCLTQPETAASEEIALNNAYRLLESYRIDPLFRSELPTTGASEPLFGSMRSRSANVRQNMSLVDSALTAAVATAFQGQSKDEAIKFVEDTLRSLTYPGKFGDPSQDRLQKSRHFFQIVSEKLQPST